MIKRLNDRIAEAVTDFIGSMWCAYLFCAMAVYGYHSTEKVLGFINWFTEEFLQLVLLSVIMVGQKVQAERTEALHETVRKHHRLLTELRNG